MLGIKESKSSFFFKFIVKNRSAGNIKIVIIIKLNANKPITFNNCITSIDHEKLYVHKFHGKPVKIFALR